MERHEDQICPSEACSDQLVAALHVEDTSWSWDQMCLDFWAFNLH